MTAAELQQYYSTLVKDLKVTSVAQLKYVLDEDLVELGLSKPEIRRLRQHFKKYSAHGTLGKLKKVVRNRKMFVTVS